MVRARFGTRPQQPRGGRAMAVSVALVACLVLGAAVPSEQVSSVPHNEAVGQLVAGVHSELGSGTADSLGRFPAGLQGSPPPDAEMVVPWYPSAARDDSAREVLEIVLVQEEEYINGLGVLKWISLTVGSTVYIVGLRSDGITLQTATYVAPVVGAGRTYSLTENVFHTQGTPTAATIFQHWNSQKKVMEAILIVAVDSREINLTWYRLGTNTMAVIDSWPFPSVITNLRVLQVGDHSYKLLLVTKCVPLQVGSPCKSYAHIYDFTLSPFEPKLSQSFSFDGPVASVEVGSLGDELYFALALPEVGAVKLYHYHRPSEIERISGNSTCGVFKNWREVNSPNVTHAVFFHVSYRMYLAVGGTIPSIYRFVGTKHIEGCSKALQNLGAVYRWKVLPVETYRDEVVVLAEMATDDGVFSPKKIVRALTWGGVGVFRLKHHPLSDTHGSCLLEEGSSVHLDGAVALQLGDVFVLTILVPRGEQKVSALFRLHTELQPIANPLMWEISLLDSVQHELERTLLSQELLLDEAERMLENTLKTDGSDVVTADWVIQKVITTEHISYEPDANMEGYPTIAELEGLLEELAGITKILLNSSSDAAVFDGETLHLSGPAVLLGGIEVVGHTVLDNLTVTKLNGELISTVLKDAVRFSDKTIEVGGMKTLLDVEASDLYFTTINGVPKDDLIFDVQNIPIVINGTLSLSNQLHVQDDIDLPSHGTVNNIDISEEVFQAGKPFKGSPHIRHVTIEGDLTVDVVNTIQMHPGNLRIIAKGYDWLSNNSYNNLEVKGNLEVEWINGYHWNDLVRRMVWKDANDHIDGLTSINGVFNSESGINIGQLNNLQFPEDYVLKNAKSQIISGEKNVLGHLLVMEADIKDTIDGVPLKSLITLTTLQELDGFLTLNEVDIYDDMKVERSINDISLDQILNKSAIIGQGLPVSWNVDFMSHLEVQGRVLVSHNANGLELKDFLDDLVTVSGDQADGLEIKSRKILRAGLTVSGPGLVTSSGLLNGIHVGDFARVDWPQTFTGVTNIEQTSFRNLQLTGLWDGVNVVELNADTIRLTGNQESSAALVFAESSELEASRLIVLEQLNNQPAKTMIEKVAGSVCNEQAQDCTINGPITADSITVDGDFIIDGMICGKNLNDFLPRRLSRSRPQTIRSVISFGTMYVNRHLQIDYINDVPVTVIQTQLPPQTIFNMQHAFLTGSLAVDELFVDGKIEIAGGVNGVNVTYVSQMAVKLFGDNVLQNDLIFDNLNVDVLEVKGHINNKDLSYIVRDFVSLREVDNVTISGSKYFSSLTVDGTIFAPVLSGTHVSKIITKSSPFTTQGSLSVSGNVFANNIDVSGLLNKLPVHQFLNRYKFIQGKHLLRGDAHFDAGVSVKELFVKGKINDVVMDEFFKSVVMKADSTRILGNKYFINRVTFNNIALKGLFQSIALQELAKDMIMCNGDDIVVINGPITFNKTLVLRKGVTVLGDLQASELDGCRISEWFENAIYLNKAMTIGGVKTFSNISAQSNLQLSRLNAVDMSKVIKLNVPQVIPANIHIQHVGVQHNLDVHGRVNGMNLPAEYANTLMTKGNQIVKGQKTFLSGITVEGNVVAKGYINGFNLSNAVTLDSVQTIEGPLLFQNIMLDGNLVVDGLISDIDVQNWKDRAFLKNAQQPQFVSGLWNVLGQVWFKEDVGGEGLLNGENVHNLEQEVQNMQRNVQEIQKSIKENLTKLCQDTNALLAKAHAQPFLFQQLEVVQALQLPLTSSMHAFEAGEEQFLAVSFANNCSGAIYHWNRDSTSWNIMEPAMQYIGGIDRWASLQNMNTTYLITSTSVGTPNCTFSGGNIWRVGPGLALRNIRSMEPWHEAQVDESRGHFYTLTKLGVEAWSIQDGVVALRYSWQHEETDPTRARFVPRSLGLGLSVSDGQWLKVLSRSQEKYDNLQLRSANSFLPSKDSGSIAVMEVSNGRKLLAVAQNNSDVLVVYDDVASGRTLGTVRAHRAHSLSVLELAAGMGRPGQTLLAFVEDERILRVIQYKGVEGFVDVTRAKLVVSVKEMIPVRLQARRFVSPRHFLLLRSDYQVLLLELEMTGDPLNEPPLPCDL